MNLKLRKYLKYLFFISIFLYLKNLSTKKHVYPNTENQDSSNASQFIRLLNKFNNFKFQIDNLPKNNNKTISENEIFNLINKILFRNRACLIDKNLLQRINKNNINELKNIYELQKYSSKSSISYGLNVENLEMFFKDLSYFKFLCNIAPTFSKKFNLTIPCAIYIKCGLYMYQIMIMYTRGNFYWLPKDNVLIISKLYGDHERALNKFETTVIVYEKKYITIPFEIDNFLFMYKNSKFLECSHELAKLQDPLNDVEKNFLSSRYIYVKNFFVKNNISIWLMAGSLLGWYRNCGVIRHTKDADMSLFSFEYVKKIDDFFLQSKILPLSLKFGLDNDSLELRVGQETEFHIDIFITYEYNDTHQWFPYHKGREVNRQIIRKFTGICSAELFEEKFFVPCNPIQILNDLYGVNGWQKANKKYRISPFLRKWKRWNVTEWLNAIKFYNNGKFLKERTKKFIKLHLNSYERQHTKI